MSKPNFELLKDGYAIVGGIPDDKIDLAFVLDERGPTLDCGTICCAAGWLALHPRFQKLGVGLNKLGEMTINGHWSTYAHVMSSIFNIPYRTAEELFGRRTVSESRNANRTLTDKQVWLARVRKYLKQHDQLGVPA